MAMTAGAVRAQNGASLGLGGAYTALARGPEAIFWNPANLGYHDPDAPDLQDRLFSLGLAAGNNAFTIDLYNKYNGTFISEAGKREILNEISDEDGVKFASKIDAQALAITYKNFGFSLEGNALFDASLPKGAFELGLNGFDLDRYTFKSTSDGFVVSRVNFSYGRALWNNKFLELTPTRVIKFRAITAGATLSYIGAGAIFETLQADNVVTKDDNGIGVNFRNRTREAEGGNGVGLDIGFGFITETDWQFGVTFDNVVGRMNWSDQAKTRLGTLDLERPRFIDEFEDLDISARKNAEVIGI